MKKKKYRAHYAQKGKTKQADIFDSLDVDPEDDQKDPKQDATQIQEQVDDVL